MTERAPDFALSCPADPSAPQEKNAPAAVKTLSYFDAKDLPEAPVIRQLCRWCLPVSTSRLCADVLDMFIEDADLYALPLIDTTGSPCALIERHAYVEYFSRRFTIEIHGKRTLAEAIDSLPVVNRRPIVVDAATSIDNVAQIIIDAGMQHMVSGFIITQDEEYLGIANGHDLLNNIAQRKQEELYYLAHYDPLTKLPNRLLMADRLTMACRESMRDGKLVGLLFVDLDRFKQINDTMGHRFGDFLLQAVADRLEGCIRAIDTVSRLGGDEFAILLEHLTDVQDAEMLAQRIVDALQRPFTILEHELFVTASIGIAIYPRDDVDVGNLFAKADAAMYEAKESGRNAFRKYVPGLSKNSLEHLSLEADLRHALERDELILHYQPQINVASGTVIGVEALIRWQHPTRGMVSPAAFIPIAEESGFIIDIGRWVLWEACRQQQEWLRSGMPPLRMAINISAVQFRRSNFVDIVRDVLQETGIDPALIELELTESIAMHRASEVLNTLRELKALGVKLAIDDFGTGFSSLSYLQRFPIDRLKIDQSFIRGIENMPANRSIVQAIVAMAQTLALDVIAEGVGTEAEYACTCACACNEVQGYFHSRPLPADDFLAWLCQWATTPAGFII